MDELTSAQLSEWEAYDVIDPVGSWRSDFRFAQLQSLMLNIVNNLYGEEGKKSEQTTPIDFMPVWDAEARKKMEEKQVQRQSSDDMLRILTGIAAAQDNKLSGVPRNPPVKK